MNNFEKPNTTIEQDENLKITPETFKDEKYWERRNLIEKPDKDIIEKELKEKHDYKDSGQGFLREQLRENPKFVKTLKRYLENKDLINIGCGKWGFEETKQFIGEKNIGCNDSGSWVKVDLGIKDFYLVDPYAKPENYDEELEIQKRYYEKHNEENENVAGVEIFRENAFHDLFKKEEEGKITKDEYSKEMDKIVNSVVYFHQQDGLSFLNNFKSKTGCCMTVNIDACIISSSDYTRRIAQEIYRVTSEDGVYVCIGSPYIENEAKLLFPIVKKYGIAKVFMKKDLEIEQNNPK